MRELPYKVQKLVKGCLFNLHRHMLRIKHNAVLIIIYIRGILESPGTVVIVTGIIL